MHWLILDSRIDSFDFSLTIIYLFQDISSTTEAINVEDEEVVTTTEISVDETTSQSLSRILTGTDF